MKQFLTWLPLVILLIFAIYSSLHFPIHDFGNYYFGSKLLLLRQFSEKVYEPLYFNRTASALTPQHLWLNYSPNSPFTAVAFVGFSLIGVYSAKIAFNIISIAFFLFSFIRLTKHVDVDGRFISFYPLVVAIPLFYHIQFGQAYLLLFVFLTEGYLAYRKQNYGWASFWWSIAILLKFTPVLLIVLLLVKKEWKALAYLVTTSAVLFLISVIVVGIDTWIFFIQTILPRASQGDATAAAFTINYQSVFIVLKYLFVFDYAENPSPVLDSPLVFHLLTLLFKIAVISLSVFYTKKENDAYRCFSIWIAAMFLLSPYGNTYGYVLLLFPLLSIQRHASIPTVIIIFALTFVLTSIPVNILYRLPFVFQFPRVLLSLAIFIAMLKICERSFSFSLSTFTLILILLCGSEVYSYQSHRSASTYVLKDNPALTYDFSQDGDRLKISHWSDKGAATFLTTIEVKSLVDLPIQNNQIILNQKAITNSRDTKIKAAVLNGTEVIYLTDEDRGYGFYVLKSLAL